jgi:hypothetical protein
MINEFILIPFYIVRIQSIQYIYDRQTDNYKAQLAATQFAIMSDG